MDILCEAICVFYEDSGAKHEKWIKIGSEKIASYGTYTDIDQSRLLFDRLEQYALDAVNMKHKKR